MSNQDDLASLITEQRNENSFNIDSKSVEEIIEIFNNEDQKAVNAVIREKENIAKAVNIIVDAFKNGGRLFYVGAGTSGRLGVLDSAECPPTFGVGRELVQGIIAGGNEALVRSIEGAEDRAEDGASAIRDRSVTAKDVVVGIASSGRTPYVIGALQEAKKIGAKTVFLLCNPLRKEMPFIDVFITPIVGPEIITGSTRLKAGTATKLILNMLSSISMIKIGKVYNNLMVDVQAWNEKLADRSERLIVELGKVDRNKARELLKMSKGSAKIAIVMARRNVSYDEAISLLNENDGFLRNIVDSEI
jgi:N-acetylmuramic acid 6-phosphate etherase